MWYDGSVVSTDATLKHDSVDVNAASFKSLFVCAGCCNRAEWDADDDASPSAPRAILGDASETALFRYCDSVMPIEKVELNRR